MNKYKVIHAVVGAIDRNRFDGHFTIICDDKEVIVRLMDKEFAFSIGYTFDIQKINALVPDVISVWISNIISDMIDTINTVKENKND